MEVKSFHIPIHSLEFPKTIVPDIIDANEATVHNTLIESNESNESSANSANEECKYFIENFFFDKFQQNLIIM